MNQVMQALMVPRSIAVIGASTDPDKVAGKPIFYLQKSHYQGAIYPVNPRASLIAGLKSYPSISDLPEVPDVAMILLGTKDVIDAVKELSRIGTKVAIVLTSGFAEAGEEGLNKQNELMQAAGSMRILGPNTIGLVNLTDGIPLSPSGALAIDNLPIGHVSVISQSGGILGSILSRAAARGLGLAKLISTSNEVDLSLADFIEYLVDDKNTKMIMMYVESIRHPERFRTAALRARSAGKPLIVYKVGKSAAGMQAAVSHTGAMAGEDRIYDVFFKELGIIRANQFADFIDIPVALSLGKKLLGKRVAILTSTGGAGTLVADSLGEHGFDVAAPNEQITHELRQLGLGDQAVLDRNPIDVTLAGIQPKILKGAIAAILNSDFYDALVLILGGSSLVKPELMGEAVQDFLRTSPQPILAYASPHAPKAVEILTALGVPSFTQPESCGIALKSMLQTNKPIAKSPESIINGNLPIDLPFPLLGTLDEFQAKQLFQAYGIPTVQERRIKISQFSANDFLDKEQKYVVKILSKEILHKTEVGGVMLNVLAKEIPAKMLEMRERVKVASLIDVQEFSIQEMLPSGLELMVGIHKDPLGTALLVGLGGITAELINDHAIRLLHSDNSLGKEDILAMLQELKCWPLLNGYRGKPLADVDALIDAIIHFSEMVMRYETHLIECEINPIFVFEKGRGVKAADGVVIFTTPNPLKVS